MPTNEYDNFANPSPPTAAVSNATSSPLPTPAPATPLVYHELPPRVGDQVTEMRPAASGLGRSDVNEQHSLGVIGFKEAPMGRHNPGLTILEQHVMLSVSDAIGASMVRHQSDASTTKQIRPQYWRHTRRS